VAKVLHTSDQVRSEIRRIFRVPGRRRVAIVAYVGRGEGQDRSDGPSGPVAGGGEVVCRPLQGRTGSASLKTMVEVATALGAYLELVPGTPTSV